MVGLPQNPSHRCDQVRLDVIAHTLAYIAKQIRTFRVSDLQVFANRIPGVGVTLRLDEIGIRYKSFSLKILPELRSQGVKLTPKVYFTPSLLYFD